MTTRQKTESGIDINYVLKSVNGEYQVIQSTVLKYDSKGERILDDCASVMKCEIREIRTKQLLSKGEGSESNIAIDMAIEALVSERGIEPGVLTKEAALQRQIETLAKQVAVLSAALATNTHIPESPIDAAFDSEGVEGFESHEKTTGKRGRIKTPSQT